VIERQATRDHTERLLAHFGADVTRRETDGGVTAAVTGYADLRARDLDVPADISSAAFPLVAALITEDSDILLENVGINPLRAGLLTTLQDMGADITLANERVEGGEPVADIRARSSALKGVDVPPERAPAMIDEYPILAVAAAAAQGTTTMRGVGELRVKESDRLMAMARLLNAAGITVAEDEDSLTVQGGPITGGVTAATFLDHRIAMAAPVPGLAAKEPIGVDSAAMIETSFPGFAELMQRLGAAIVPGESA
jgi:3-phosphoshikimate 1-carboxyvinyltransferase